MQSTTSDPPADRPSSSSSPSTSTPLKRRHRVDSHPRDQGSSSSSSSSGSAPDFKRVRPDNPPLSSSSSSSSTSISAPARAASSSASSSSRRPHPTAMLSSKALGKRPEVIDLTGGASHGSSAVSSPRTSGGPATVVATTTTTTTTTSGFGARPVFFRPHTGARKLVIKPLRAATAPTSSSSSADEYYARIRADLEAALASVFAGRPPSQPLERLYRGVEDLCRKGDAAALADLLAARFDDHLRGDVLGRIRAADAAHDPVAALRAVLAQWKTWSAQLLLVRSIFSFLDRSFLLGHKTRQELNDVGIAAFRRIVFPDRKGPGAGTSGGGSSGGDEAAPGARVVEAMCQLVDWDRRGDARFDPPLLKEAVSMLHVLGTYDRPFEPAFLRRSRAFFETFAEERSAALDLKAYIAACESLLRREDHRCAAFHLDSTTKRQLLDAAHAVLIDRYSDKLLHGGSVARLLDDHEVASVRALYDLLRLSGIQKRLRQPWERYIHDAGAAIVTDTARGDDMIVRLLTLRRRLDVMIRDAFAGDDDFTYGLREAFGSFVNSPRIASAWNTGTSKVGEMIAKYIDMLLRGGLKTLPPALLSDRADRAAAERGGLASTADEDAELDRQLDSALELFRFVQGKDVFEAFYKRDLARRLLMGRSASQDAERNMLTKLKSECGASFTHNLEQMFKDQELTKEEMAAYKAFRAGSDLAATAPPDDLDLSVSILSAAAWPSTPDVPLHLPPDVLRHVEHFERYYKQRHTGRRLTWKHDMAHSVVKARFDRGVKELLVSAFQAAVLVLFNDPPPPPPPPAASAADAATDDDKGAEARDQTTTTTDAGPVLSYEQISQATGLTGAQLERTLQSLACGKVRVLQKHPKGKEVRKTDTFTVNRAFWVPQYRIKINQIQLKETKEENRETHERVAADRQFETQAAIVRIMKSRKVMTHLQLVTEVIEQTRSRGAVEPSEIKKNIERLIEKEYIDREGSEYKYVA